MANMKWRFSLLGAAATGVTSLLTIALILGALRLDLFTLLDIGWLGVPVFLWVLLFTLAAGLLAGYREGSRLKRRLDRLWEAILHFERGDYGHRLPTLGHDEIGLVAERLNEMAAQVQRQVASLHRLSTEQAQWREGVKRAAIMEERQRLARELHDAVSQQLFAIAMMSAAVLEQVPQEEAPLRRQIVAIESSAGKAQTEMRALLLHLRPAILEGKGLKRGLEELLVTLGAQQPVTVRSEIAELPPLPQGVEDHLFRIVQEALSNAIRHARAASVTVRLRVVDRQVRLKIIDDGMGFSPDRVRASSYGLQLIQERASEIGGVAEVISVPGKGTQVEVIVSLVEGEKGDDSAPAGG